MVGGGILRALIGSLVSTHHSKVLCQTSSFEAGTEIILLTKLLYMVFVLAAANSDRVGMERPSVLHLSPAYILFHGFALGKSQGTALQKETHGKGEPCDLSGSNQEPLCPSQAVLELGRRFLTELNRVSTGYILEWYITNLRRCFGHAVE